MRSKAKPALKRGVGAEETGLILSPCGNALPLPEQSLYSGKARSSAGGMERGRTLSKALPAEASCEQTLVFTSFPPHKDLLLLLYGRGSGLVS